MGVGAGAALCDETLDAAERSAQLFALKFTDLSTTAARCSPRSLRACAGRRTAVTRMCVLPGSICAVGGAVRRRLRRGPPLAMVATSVATQLVWKWCQALRLGFDLGWRAGSCLGAWLCSVWGQGYSFFLAWWWWRVVGGSSVEYMEADFPESGKVYKTWSHYCRFPLRGICTSDELTDTLTPETWPWVSVRAHVNG